MAISSLKVELPGCEAVFPKPVITSELQRNELPLRARPASLAPSPETACVHEYVCACKRGARSRLVFVCIGRCPANECPESC